MRIRQFALSPANLQSLSLCCNHLHRPLQVHTKKSFLLSLLRPIYPLHLLSALFVPQNPNQLLHRVQTCPVQCIPKGHVTPPMCTGQNVGVTVQSLLEKSQERDLTRFSFYGFWYATFPPFTLQAQKCNLLPIKQSIYSYFLACSTLPLVFWPFFYLKTK